MVDVKSPENRGFRTGITSVCFAVLTFFLVFSSRPAWGQVGAASQARERSATVVRQKGEVLLEDGTVHEGMIQLTPTNLFYMWILPKGATSVGGGRKTVREFNFDIIQQMEFKPIGSRRKVIVTFNDGQKLEGVLKSTVVYVHVEKTNGQRAAGVKKFLIKSQTREQQLVTKIRIKNAGRQVASRMPLVIPGLELGAGGEVLALTAETLAPVPVKPLDRPGHYEVERTMGEKVFLAARIGDTYVAGWPEEGARRNNLFREVEIHLKKIKDWYNERKLLGIMVDETGSVVHCLVSLRRQCPENAAFASGGNYDADGAIEHFRLSIWRWKRNPENGEMALSKRGSFCRDRVSPHAETPWAEISSGLWPVVSGDGKMVVGSAPMKTEWPKDER